MYECHFWNSNLHYLALKFNGTVFYNHAVDNHLHKQDDTFAIFNKYFDTSAVLVVLHDRISELIQLFKSCNLLHENMMNEQKHIVSASQTGDSL